MSALFMEAQMTAKKVASEANKKAAAITRDAEEKAKELGLKQVVLCARKGTFLIPWYQRRGYEIYDENPEYSKGQTVAMNKYFEDKE